MHRVVLATTRLPAVRCSPAQSVRAVARALRVPVSAVRVTGALPARRWQSTDAAGQAKAGAPAEGADKPADGAAGAQGEQIPEEEVTYQDIEEDRPFIAKLAGFIWTAIKLALISGIVGVVLYAGYTIIVTLLPAGASANAIMRHASDKLKHDTEISKYFGADVRTYGEDFGSRAEGRRYFVPDYTYTDDDTGVKWHRVKFTLEAADAPAHSQARKATVWAEVRHGTYDFRYIIALTKDGQHVFTLVDNRPAMKTMDQRQSEVSALLFGSAWKFYADNRHEEEQQRDVLGPYTSGLRVVLCDGTDRTKAECAAVPNRPAWGRPKEAGVWDAVWGTAKEGYYKAKSMATGTTLEEAGGATGPSVEIVRGIQGLKGLEAMTRDLRQKRAEAKVSWWGKVKAMVGLGGSGAGAAGERGETKLA